jgi:signal transduction histidine kinase
VPDFGQRLSGCLETDSRAEDADVTNLSLPDSTKPVFIGVVVVAISVAHYTTSPAHIWWHVAYQELCYVPILIAAYWFGVAGGLATAVIAGLGTILHFHHEWENNTPFIVSSYGQAVGFVIAGTVGGALATAEKHAAKRHRQALKALETAHAELETAHTELKTSHDQLLHADRLSSLGEIAAGLAHEIGNPLAGVKGALEIIASRATRGSPDAEFSEVASREVARLEGLVAEFLRFARPHEPHRMDIDIADVLDA